MRQCIVLRGKMTGFAGMGITSWNFIFKFVAIKFAKNLFAARRDNDWAFNGDLAPFCCTNVHRSGEPQAALV